MFVDLLRFGRCLLVLNWRFYGFAWALELQKCWERVIGGIIDSHVLGHCHGVVRETIGQVLVGLLD
jgi:hypothetical protein